MPFRYEGYLFYFISKFLGVNDTGKNKPLIRYEMHISFSGYLSHHKIAISAQNPQKEAIY